MYFELNHYYRNLSDEELLEDLRKVAKKYSGQYISKTLYMKEGSFSVTPFLSRWGSWTQVLKIAGLKTKRTQSEYKKISKVEMISDIKRVSEMLKKNPITTTEYSRYGTYTTQTILRRFGSWNCVLEEAGLRRTEYKKILDIDLFKEIERLWIKKGSQPTTTDIKRGYSKYSLNTYSRRFGGWRKALETFIAYKNMNQNEADNILSDSIQSEFAIIELEKNSKEIVLKHCTPREANARLRFMVLKRDNYKCCICGDSPAKDSSVELHIDHIIPWSKGGETVLENLQTLCAGCNLGKSDLMMDRF